MNNMNVSDKIKQLFYGLKMLDDEKIFPYSNFKNDEFFFITRDNKILSLLTAWIKHINEKEIVCISLYKEKDPSDKPPFIFVKPKGTPFKWLIEEKSAGVYYLTEKRFTEEDESSGYELIDTIYYPYEFEFFSSEYPQMALKSQANVPDEDKIQARELLQPLLETLDQNCINGINEIFDGDAPHTPRGTVNQAWSVGELLVAYEMSRI